MRIQDVKKPFQTILVMVLGLMGLWLWLKADVLMYIGLGVGVLAALLPITASYIAWGWMKFGEALGWINSKIILSIVFFAFLFPIALIYQMIRKNPLYLKNKQDSIFQDRDHTFEKKDLEQTW